MAREDLCSSKSSPEMQVIRQANQVAPESDVLEDFRADLMEVNSGRGSVTAFENLSVVYVSPDDIDSMLQEKYPDAYSYRPKAIKLQRRLASELNAFVRDSNGQAFNVQTQELEIAQGFVALALATTSYEPNFGEAYFDGHIAAMQVTEEEKADALQRRENPFTMPETVAYFGDALLEVTGLEDFGDGEYGLDLSGNDQLYQERQAVVGFFQREAKLNTNRLQRHWTPYAPVFKLGNGSEVAELGHTLPVPATLAVDKPSPVVKL